MISFDEAIDLIRSEIRPVGVEQVPLGEAAGRVTASQVLARVDSPRSDVSAMDGYAACDRDLGHFPLSLEISGKSFAGSGAGEQLARGTCTRIFTGAPLPAGADRVIIQENVQHDGTRATIKVHPGAESHIRRRGSDFQVGDVLLGLGRLLNPRAIVAAGGADVSSLQVFKRPRLQILSTGDELAEPGTAHQRAHAVPDSISLGIAALAVQWGADIESRICLPDDLDDLKAAASRALEIADVIAVTGGASVGEKDFAKAMFEPHGLEIIFSKVAIKPGKPLWFARAQNRLIIGFPGNPTSAMVTARLFLAPLLAGLTGRNMDEALNWRTLPIGSSIGKCEARETFHRASLAQGSAQILPFQHSSAQKALVDADLLVRQSANSPSLDAGELVDVLDF